MSENKFEAPEVDSALSVSWGHVQRLETISICVAVYVAMHYLMNYPFKFQFISQYYSMFQSLGGGLPSVTILALKIGDPFLGIVLMLTGLSPLFIIYKVKHFKVRVISVLGVSIFYGLWHYFLLFAISRPILEAQAVLN